MKTFQGAHGRTRVVSHAENRAARRSRIRFSYKMRFYDIENAFFKNKNTFFGQELCFQAKHVRMFYKMFVNV